MSAGNHTTLLGNETIRFAATAADRACHSSGGDFCNTAELSHTYGLVEEMRHYFGDSFAVEANISVMGKNQPYCKYATSKR